MRRIAVLALILAASVARAGDSDEGHPVKIEPKEWTEEQQKEHEAAVKDLVNEFRREKNKVMLLGRFDQFGESGGELERDALILYCRMTKNQQHLCSAFMALAKIGGAESLNFLCGKQALKSRSDWIVQRGAAEALAELSDPRAACCLIEIAENRRQKTMVRGICLVTLARIAKTDEAANETVHRLADVKDDILRRDAMTALGHLGTEKAFEILADRCRSEQNGEVRAYACSALALHGSRAGVPILQEVIEKDSALQVKDAAMRALKELGGMSDR